MTPHDHSQFVPGCFRCELGRDEAMNAITEERDEYRQAALELHAEIRALKSWIDTTGEISIALAHAIKVADAWLPLLEDEA